MKSGGEVVVELTTGEGFCEMYKCTMRSFIGYRRKKTHEKDVDAITNLSYTIKGHHS